MVYGYTFLTGFSIGETFAKGRAVWVRITGQATLTLVTILTTITPAGSPSVDRLTLSSDIAITFRAAVTAITFKTFSTARTRLSIGLQVTVTEARAPRPWWTGAAIAEDARAGAGG